MSERIDLFLPIKTVSEANTSEHWSKASARHKKQQKLLRQFLIHIPRKNYPLPCKITWTRCGVRMLDPDNLQIAFKYMRDELSDIILGNIYSKVPENTQKIPKNEESQPEPVHIPKRLKGRNDDDPRLEWHYTQKTGKVHGTWITIEPNCTEIPNS